MKQRFRFLALWLLCLLAMGLSAQTSWTACALAEGTFFLYNVGNAGFLYGANDWGTRASITKDTPLALTFTAGSDGGYYISTSPVYNGRYLGSDGYVDKESSSSKYTTWIFTPVEGQENVYTMKAGNSTGNYLYGHASDWTKTSVGTSLLGNEKDYWKLVSRDAWIAAMANATEDNPMDVTFLVQDAYFGAGTDVNKFWTGDGSVSTGGPVGNYCGEFWSTTFDVHQEITGLPNGIYKMQIQGFYRVGNGSNDASAAAAARANGEEVLNAKYYINDTEGSLMSIFDSDLTHSNNSTYNTSSAVTINGTNYYVPTTKDRAAACFGQGEYTNELIQATVINGTVRLGIRNTVSNSADWAIFDNVKLYYYGAGLTLLQESYTTQLATAKSLQPEPMQARVKTALNDAVTAAETDVDMDSKDWLEAVLATLGTAIANAQASNALYTSDILTAVNAMKAQSVKEEVKIALQTKYEDGEYTDVASVYTIYQALEIAALGTAVGTDYTSVLFNHDFEQGQFGWTGISNTGGTDTNKCAEMWSTTFDVYQTVAGLPNGYYMMKIQGFYRVGDGANDASAAAAAREAGNEALYAKYYINDASGPLKSIFDSDYTHTNNSTYNTSVAVTINGTSYYVPSNMPRAAACFSEGQYLTDGIQGIVTDGTLRLGVKKSANNNSDWAIWDNVQLIYMGSYAPASYTDVAINLNIENNEVAGYLNDNTYTESSTSVLGNYDTSVGARNDQPAAARIFLPAQTGDATLYVSLNSDYSSAKTYTIAAGKDNYEVSNFLPAQTYYYKVVGDADAVVTNGTITTTGHLRMIKAERIDNMRDLGGWLNADGNRIKYGKIYRGTELKAGYSYTATDADLAMLKDDLNIGAEVDLRQDSEFANGLMSTSAIDGATYYYANLNCFDENALNFYAYKFKNAFDLVLAALKADKAAYFHCIYGADRTGCFAFLLEGLLGLPVDQLYKDYELTSFSSPGTRAKTGIDQKLQYIKALQGNNLQEKFYNYWRGAVGVSETDLNDFINIMIDGTSPITTATLADLPEKAVADGEYYLYLPTYGKFLGRGEAYGARALADNYGVPASVTTNGANVTTIKYLDNNLSLGSDCYTDKYDNYNTVSWCIEKHGDDLILRSFNGYYMCMYQETVDKPRANVTTAAEATPVAFKTLAEQKAIVAATQEANILAAAAAAGITASDLASFNAQLATFTSQPSAATIKSANEGNKSDWTFTAGTGDSYNVGDYGGELYQTTGTVSQTVNVPHPGLYKLTLNAFYRQGSDRNCYPLGQAGYELSNAYVSVNGEYFTQIPSWYSDCASSTDPNSTWTAKAQIDAGKYPIELYAYIGNEKKATITIHVPGYTPEGWCLFNKFALTEYVKEVTLSENATIAPEAIEAANVTLERTITEGFNTLCLPFSLTSTQMQTAFGNDVKVYTLTGEEATGTDSYKLNFTEGRALAANTPAIISGVAADKAGSSYTFKGVCVEPTATLTSSTDHFNFIGTYTTGTVPAGDYFLKKGTSEIVKSVGNTMRGFRAYIAPKEIGNNVKSFALTFEDIPTGIETIHNSQSTIHNSQLSEAIYNLAGQRVATPARGLYIVNGKKVVK